MNRYFLVDYERIHNRSTCLNGIEHLKESDTVYILFSGEETGVSFSVMEKIQASHAKVVQKHIISDTEDALQYVIGFYLGSIAGREKEEHYAIAVISDEKFGFLPKLENISLYVSQSIGKAVAVMPVPNEETETSEWDNKFSEIMESLNLGKGIEAELHKTIQKARETADSIAAQTKVKDLFGRDLADSVYNALKPLIDPDDDDNDE